MSNRYLECSNCTQFGPSLELNASNVNGKVGSMILVPAILCGAAELGTAFVIRGS